MAGAGFYSSRVNAQVVPAAAPAESLGIGTVVSALGRTAGAIADQNRQTDAAVSASQTRVAELEKKRADDAAASSVAVKLAEGEGEHDRWAIDHQNDADFEAKANAKVDADMAALRGQLGNNPELIQHFEPILAKVAEARKTAAHERFAAVTAKASGEAIDATLTASKNNASTAPERTGEFADTVTAGIMANSAIPEALRPAAAHKAAGEVWQSGLEAAIRGGRYESVGKALEAGTYDAILPDGAKADLQRLVSAQGTAAAVAARTDAAVQAKALTDQVQSVEQIIAAGGDPGPDVLKKLHDAAVKQGDGSVATKLEIWDQQTATNRTWQGRSMIDKVTGMQELERLNGAGQLDTKGQIQLAQLRKLVSADTVNVASKLKPEYASGPQGQQAVAKQLDSLPIEQRYAAAEEVDKGFGAYMNTPATIRNVAIAGRADKDWVKGHFSHGKLGHDPTKEFKLFMGDVARDMHGDGPGLQDVATSIYAFYAKRDGVAEFDQTRFRAAINMAAGGRLVNGEWLGGLGDYNGHRVQLPDGTSQRTFDATINHFDYAGAVLPNGSPLTKAQLLKHYRVAYQGDSPDGARARYWFVDDRGMPVAHKSGVPYELTFGNH